MRCHRRTHAIICRVYLAVQQGADYIELDVQLTLDQHVAVIHDDTIDRTTDGSGLVKSYTLDQLKKLDAGSWFDERFANERTSHYKKFLKDTDSASGY